MALVRNLFAGVLVFWFTTVAHAVPMTWVDTINFDPAKFVVPNSPITYTHNIADQGYTPLVDSIYEYALTVDLYDDGDSGMEVALIDVPGVTGDKVYFDLSGAEFGGWSLAGYAQLALTGLYDVTISSLYGDFFLSGSTLTVRGERRSVPEPGVVALLIPAVLSLLGLAYIPRRRKHAA